MDIIDVTILDDGSIKCWGSNLDGELGIGSMLSHGASANTMGDNLPAVLLRESSRAALGRARSRAALAALLRPSTVDSRVG